MLTGLLPHEGKGRRSICEVHTDLDCAWDDFFERALAPAPADRFPDALSMIEALDRLEADWRTRKEATCSAADLLSEPERHEPDWRPRSEPIKVSSKSARTYFDLDDLWRPNEYGFARFEDKEDGFGPGHGHRPGLGKARLTLSVDLGNTPPSTLNG